MVTRHHHLSAPAMEAMSQNAKLCFAAAECIYSTFLNSLIQTVTKENDNTFQNIKSEESSRFINKGL